jgi:molybdate transport repressor ModE-like protein
VTVPVPDLDALALLVGVARTGSIGAAARAAGVSQQAGSERIRAVEAQVGLQLVRRGARGSELTPAGVVVVESAARLLDVAAELEHTLGGLRADRDRDLIVWSSMTVAETVLPGWLVRLGQRQVAEGRPPTTVSLTATNSQQVVSAVQDGRADLGFIEGLRAPAGVRSRGLTADELVMVAAPGSALGRRRTPLSAEEVAALPTVARERGSGTREVVEQALAAHGLVAVPPVAELTTATAVREAVLAGGAPAFVSRRLVTRELEAHALVEVRTGLALTRTFRAVWSGGREPAAGPARDLVGLARAAG